MKFEAITQEDLQKMYKDGITPEFKYESFDTKTNTYSNLTIIKTAEEVLQEHSSMPPNPQPTADEILGAKLIKDNANMQLQLMQQQKLNADILLKIAKLGGTTNV